MVLVLASVYAFVKFLRKDLNQKLSKLRSLTNLAVLLPQLLCETKEKNLGLVLWGDLSYCYHFAMDYP